MPKEILIYDDFNRWSAERIVSQLSEVDDGAFDVRLNSPGGGVTAGIAVLSKLGDMPSGNKIIVDGEAMSMAAFMLIFFKERVANDMSEFMLHKAAYPSWHEPSAEQQERLVTFNNAMKAKMEAANIDQNLIDRIFKPDVREDVYLTAKEALEAGLITEVKELKVADQQALQAQFHGELQAFYEKTEQTQDPAARRPQSKRQLNTPNKEDKMDLQELKIKHPALFAEAVKQGVATERKRTKQILGYVKADGKTANGRAIKAIADGEDLMDIMGEMSTLQNAEARTIAMAGESLEDLGTDPDGTDPASDGKKADPKLSAEAKYKADEAELSAYLKGGK